MEQSFKVGNGIVNENSFKWISFKITLDWKYEKEIKLSVKDLPDGFNWNDSISNARSLTYTLFNAYWLKIKINKTFLEDWKMIITIDNNIKINKSECEICLEILKQLK